MEEARRKRALQWLFLCCLIVHILFLALLGPFSELVASQVRERMKNDLDFYPGYEMWEADVILGVTIVWIPLVIYLPAVVLTVFVNAWRYKRRGKTKWIWKPLGVGIGVLTILYGILVLLWA